ncbi:hypothetical protein [Hahella ganghwensis]|uniref:hypothetical protein n=1 Tax=Hahella ganghwensis TaxID=286420 RepID=UPI00039BCA1B|nr:hypothetical protein [Hahella ganghwensis]
MNKELLLSTFKDLFDSALESITRIETYSEIGIIILVYALAYGLAGKLRKLIPLFNEPPGRPQEHPVLNLTYRFGRLLFPLFAILLLRLTLEFSQLVMEEGWLMKGALIVAMLLLYNSFITLAIPGSLVAQTFRWIGLPILFLHLIGVLDDITRVLESIAIEIGNINLSVYGLVRVMLFGSLLFWLGRVSNSTGQTIIRRQQSLDIRTREVLAKLFEIALFFIIFLLMLQVMGINLTALAIFGGGCRGRAGLRIAGDCLQLYLRGDYSAGSFGVCGGLHRT